MAFLKTLCFWTKGFLDGKLIFHDPPGNYLRSNGTHHLPQSALGIIPKQKMLLPAIAAFTEDLLTWDKYDAIYILD